MTLLILPGTKNCIAVPVEEIIRVEASSNYSRIYFSDGKKITVTKILNWFEDTLPAEMFARVHRSHLINKMFVQEIIGTGAKTLLLHNGELISISRRKRMSVT